MQSNIFNKPSKQHNLIADKINTQKNIAQISQFFISFQSEDSSLLEKQQNGKFSTMCLMQRKQLSFRHRFESHRTQIQTSAQSNQYALGRKLQFIFSILIIKFKIFLKAYAKKSLFSLPDKSSLNCFKSIANDHQAYLLKVFILYFLFPLYSSTISCGINNCNACSGPTMCTQCDLRYAWDAGLTTCAPCLDNACLTCSMPGAMNVCDVCSYNFIRSTWGVCYPCILPHCQVCTVVSNSATCQQCVYGALMITDYCQLCSNLIANCDTCNSTVVCDTCKDGFTLSGNGTTCPPCNSFMAGCTKCSSTTVCTQCHTDTYYHMTGAIACSLCSNNPSLPNCYSCEYTGAYCTTCQPNFMLSITNQCSTCASVVPNCSTCGTSACTSCSPGWALSSGSCISCQTLILNCGYCTPTNCTSCLSGYYLSGFTCAPCSTLTNCTICTSATICTTCIVDNVVITNGSMNICQSCSILMSGCLSCIVFNACVTCDFLTGYFLDTGSLLCSSCISTLQYCGRCPNATTCDQCISNQYTLNSSSQCQACIVLLSACLTCNSTTQCTSCISNDFYLNITDNVCHYCNTTQFQCKQCVFQASLNMKCTKCHSGFHLNYKQECVCDSGKLINGFCIDVVGCVNASYGPVCTACDIGMLLVHQRCECPTGLWFVTDLCTNVTGCIVVLRSPPLNTCIFCDLLQNFVVGNDSQCHCKAHYEMINGTCQDICGDGYVIDNKCDDNNTNNGDGCSSICTVESGFICSIQNDLSKCVYAKKFTITLVKIQKLENQNSGMFIFEFSPAVSTLAAMNWTKYLNVTVPGANFTLTGSAYKSGLLYINFDYGSSLKGLSADLSISLDPSLFSSGPYNFTFPIVSDGLQFNFLVKLQIYKLVQYAFLALGFMAILIFLASLPFHKMLGVETIQVFQIFFTVMLVIDNYEQPFNKLAALKYTLGFTGFWKYSNSISLNTKLLYNRLGILKQFFENVILVSPISIVLTIIFFPYFYKFLCQVNQKARLNNFLKRLGISCSKLYKCLLFPFIVGFSFSSFLSLYSQTSTIKEWKTSTDTSQVTIVSTNINLSFILAFCIIYSLTFWSQILIPFKSFISKQLLSIQRAKRLYVSEYLVFSFILMCCLLGGYQISSSVSILLLTFVIFVQLFIIITTRPYIQCIHTFGIIFNQSSLAILSMSIMIRSVRIGQGSLYQEDDNFLMILLFIAMLALVDIISLIRLISVIRLRLRCRRINHTMKQPSEENLKDKMLSTLRDEINYQFKDPPVNGNDFFIQNQIMRMKNKEWSNIQMTRLLNGMQELQFNSTRLQRHEIRARRAREAF